jgi:hypothetical protein
MNTNKLRFPSVKIVCISPAKAAKNLAVKEKAGRGCGARPCLPVLIQLNLWQKKWKIIY